MATLRPPRPLRHPRHRQPLTVQANANAPGLYRYRWWLYLYSIRCLAWLAPEIGPRWPRRRRPGPGFRAAHRAAARLAPAGFNPSRCAALASAVPDTQTPTRCTLATAQDCAILTYYCNYVFTESIKSINMCAPAAAGAMVFFRRAARAGHTNGPRPSRLAPPRKRGNQS